jgi:hypothetical protein
MQKQTGPTGIKFVDFILLLFLLFLFYFFGVLKIFFFINLAIYLRSDLNFSFVKNKFGQKKKIEINELVRGNLIRIEIRNNLAMRAC